MNYFVDAHQRVHLNSMLYTAVYVYLKIRMILINRYWDNCSQLLVSYASHTFILNFPNSGNIFLQEKNTRALLKGCTDG